MAESEFERKIQKLPENLKKEVLDYVDFLLDKYENKEISKSEFSFDWEGGLKEISSEYNSVKLQHKAAELRK